MDVPQKLIHLKTINVDEDFERVYYDYEIDDETVEYEIIRSPKSSKLKKIASSAIHNDSGYEGLEKADRKLPMETVKHGMDTRKQPPPLNAETVARMFDCQDEFGDTRTRVAVAVLLVVLSVILSVFMGHGDDTNLGGKRAAIQFYYDSLELKRNDVY